MTALSSRLPFATHYALRHLGISVAVALLSAALVFGLLYPAPYRAMLGVGPIFLLVLAVDVVCGPLLTLTPPTPEGVTTLNVFEVLAHFLETTQQELTQPAGSRNHH